ncbi:DedA family protein [Thermoactinomyces mirandus]|uniref:DedA family protein n=1 Tax=Thermoactinomyces mirandus TaxID=2756294 RepID=A0A7W2ARY9_9BACL|nr:DedA family protein [Thermoactinomyces mirandus]MBA4603083.1 DedA family protein [Thermoactinomyces mirandus]
MYDILLDYVQEYGYVALFLALWLGIVGMPVSDEVIVMTGGALTAFGLLKPIPAFILTYLGVVSGLSIGYLLGNYLGAPVLEPIVKNRQKTEYYVEKARAMLASFGHFALVISYFFPVIRHLIPYLVGIGKMPYRRYAFYSCSSGFVWTLIYFCAGRLFGRHIGQIGLLVTKYGWYLLTLLVLTVSILFLTRLRKSGLGMQEGS